MIYIVSNGDMMRGVREVPRMQATEFLFIAEYLTEKRDIEAREHRKRMEQLKGGAN